MPCPMPPCWASTRCACSDWGAIRSAGRATATSGKSWSTCTCSTTSHSSVDGVTVNKRDFLAAAIEPHIRLGEKERDIAVIRIDVSGVKDGRKKRAVLQVIDYRDLVSGFTAMNRTVGYTAAIGALMIADGRLAKRGLLSPLRDVPYDLFKEELSKRGIRVSEEFTETV